MIEVQVVKVDCQKKRVEIRALNVFYTFILSAGGEVLLEGKGSYERDAKSGVNVTLFKTVFRRASAILSEIHNKEKIAGKQGDLF